MFAATVILFVLAVLFFFNDVAWFVIPTERVSQVLHIPS